MVTEIAILKIDAAQSKDFEKMHNDVVKILRRQTGYKSDKLL